MTSNRMRVEVGGVKLTVPVFQDRETTLGIVEQVNQRLAEIESKSQRIDTQAFALEAAFSFAARAAELEQNTRRETSEVLVSLTRLSASLKALLDEAPAE